MFVDNEEEAKSFDAAKHFDTAPELLDRHFNRPTKEQLRSEKLIKKRLSRKELNRIESAKAAAYTELVSRPPARPRFTSRDSLNRSTLRTDECVYAADSG